LWLSEVETIGYNVVQHIAAMLAVWHSYGEGMGHLNIRTYTREEILQEICFRALVIMLKQ